MDAERIANLRDRARDVQALIDRGGYDLLEPADLALLKRIVREMLDAAEAYFAVARR